MLRPTRREVPKSRSRTSRTSSSAFAREKQPAADAETGHRATTVCHLINICRKLGRKLQWDPQAEKFIGDDEANQLVTRPRRQGYELPPAV